LELPERLCQDLKAAIGDIQDLAKKWQTLSNLQVAVKRTCVKQRKAKKYWGETILSPQYLEKYWSECPHCPYGVVAYECM